MHHGKCGTMKHEMDFYRGKRVFITGHTGFKGVWLCKILTLLGATVTGYAMLPDTAEKDKIFKQSKVINMIHSVFGDVRDFDCLQSALDKARPELVFHLAAQPIVLESYRNPVETYSTNIMGTINILECIRHNDSVRSFVNVTTDKVYKNQEWVWGYRENDTLDGYDPYANSKSCSELITGCYRRSFFVDGKVAISTVRAGNVIGGGDFSVNRIVPDCIRAAYDKKVIQVRNPHSTRPYQHVLEPLYAYLLIAKAQYESKKFAGSYNIGPDESGCIETGKLVDLFCKVWGDGMSWESVDIAQPHEANFLRLDCTKIKNVLGWKSRWHIEHAIEKTVEWAKKYQKNDDISKLMEQQIIEFEKS